MSKKGKVEGKEGPFRKYRTKCRSWIQMAQIRKGKRMVLLGAIDFLPFFRKCFRHRMHFLFKFCVWLIKIYKMQLFSLLLNFAAKFWVNIFDSFGATEEKNPAEPITTLYKNNDHEKYLRSKNALILMSSFWYDYFIQIFHLMDRGSVPFQYKNVIEFQSTSGHHSKIWSAWMT